MAILVEDLRNAVTKLKDARTELISELNKGIFITAKTDSKEAETNMNNLKECLSNTIVELTSKVDMIEVAGTSFFNYPGASQAMLKLYDYILEEAEDMRAKTKMTALMNSFASTDCDDLSPAQRRMNPDMN